MLLKYLSNPAKQNIFHCILVVKRQVKQDFSCVFYGVPVCLFTLRSFLLADRFLSQLHSQVPLPERGEEQMFKDSFVKHMYIRITLICGESLAVAN